MSSVMADGFVQAANEMTERVLSLGPNPLRSNVELAEEKNRVSK